MVEASLRIVAPADKRLEILDMFIRLKGPTVISHGCKVCRVLQDAENADAITYVVRWETKEDLIEHFRSNRFRTILPYIEISQEPPEVEVNTAYSIGGLEFLVSVLLSQHKLGSAGSTAFQ
jgi:quinol monooxygenase YgiN